MKTSRPLLAAFAVLTFTLANPITAPAGALRPNQVAADAKWVVHLDVERLLKTQVGDFVAQKFIEPKMTKATAELQRQFDIEVDWRNIRSLTAYGWEIKGKGEVQGVLVVETGMNIPASLDTVISKLEANGAGQEVPIRRVEGAEGVTYEVRDKVYGAGLNGGVFVLSRSMDQLQQARRVIVGDSKTLADTKRFEGLRARGDDFLVAGVSEGFGDHLDLPPQAKVLKEAEGGRLTAGEKSDRLLLSLALDTKTSEAATQLQQVVQGLIALAALSDIQNPDIQQLAQSAKVEGKEKQVTLSMDLPVTNVIARVTAKAERPPRKARVERTKAKAKASAE